MTPSDAVRAVADELAAVGVPDPRVDAELLVAHVLRTTRSGLYAVRDRVDESRLRPLLERRRLR